MKNANKRIMTRYAESLSEIYEHINGIVKEITEEEDCECNPVMWFRGHARADYHLEPNIFRGAKYSYNDAETYSNNHLREEYRFQSFMSRNYDNVDYRMPQTVIEWQEVMQHFFAKTRLMDWTESLTVALEFALESFITPVKDLEISERCRIADPVVWVLQPMKLNKAVYGSFIEESQEKDWELIRKTLTTDDASSLAEQIGRELQKEEQRGIYYDIKDDNDKNINTMVGLSSLEIIRMAYKGREMEALRNFEINPFFYLLLRYFSDGIPVQADSLPPLAIIHPYHSQRIRMQKGVFTVFPYYIPNKQMKKIQEECERYSLFGMEYMPKCIQCLHSIHILNPERVAKELMQTGAKRGNIYPEMQVVSQDMENVAK